MKTDKQQKGEQKTDLLQSKQNISKLHFVDNRLQTTSQKALVESIQTKENRSQGRNIDVIEDINVLIGNKNGVNKDLHCISKNIVQRCLSKLSQNLNIKNLSKCNKCDKDKCNFFISRYNLIKDQVDIYLISNKTISDLEKLDEMIIPFNEMYLSSETGYLSMKITNAESALREIKHLKDKMKDERKMKYGEYETIQNFAQLVTIAKTMVDNCISLNNVSYFYKWFKASNEDDISMIKTNYAKISASLPSMNFMSDNSLGYDIYAQQTDNNIILLGARYRKLSIIEKAKLIIHETSHYCLHTDDAGGYGDSVSELPHDMAIKNADNYGMAAGDKYYDDSEVEMRDFMGE